MDASSWTKKKAPGSRSRVLRPRRPGRSPSPDSVHGSRYPSPRTTSRRDVKLDREFWQRYDETTRRLRERTEYHRRKAAEEKAARGEGAA